MKDEITKDDFIVNPRYSWGFVHKTLNIRIYEDFRTLGDGRQVRSGFWYAVVNDLKIAKRDGGPTDSGYCWMSSFDECLARINHVLQTQGTVAKEIANERQDQD